MEKLLKADEVAELLAIAASTVYQLAREGKLPCIKVQSSVRFRPADIQAWLEENATARERSNVVSLRR
jgi:excisionase family DNA binding protein